MTDELQELERVLGVLERLQDDMTEAVGILAKKTGCDKSTGLLSLCRNLEDHNYGEPCRMRDRWLVRANEELNSALEELAKHHDERVELRRIRTELSRVESDRDVNARVIEELRARARRGH